MPSSIWMRRSWQARCPTIRHSPPTLAAYFPQQARQDIRRRTAPASPQARNHFHHLANRIVNLAGPVFVARMKEMSGASGAEVARAFVVAEGAFGLEALKTRIDALDGKIEAQVQTGFMPRSRKSCAGWACGSSPMSRAKDDLAGTDRALSRRRGSAAPGHQQFISAEQTEESDARIARFIAPGVPDDLARDIGAVAAAGRGAGDRAAGARHRRMTSPPWPRSISASAPDLGLDRLRLLAARISASEHWDRLAIRRLVDDLFAAQRALSQSLLAKLSGTATPARCAEGACRPGRSPRRMRWRAPKASWRRWRPAANSPSPSSRSPTAKSISWRIFKTSPKF